MEIQRSTAMLIALLSRLSYSYFIHALAHKVVQLKLLSLLDVIINLPDFAVEGYLVAGVGGGTEDKVYICMTYIIR